MNIKACLSKNTDEWQTPKKLYNFFIDNNFFDPCPINHTIDGLEIEWKKHNFVNPPYSKLKIWINKAIQEMQKDKIIWLLIPSRTDTKWFKNLYDHNAKFMFIQQRLKFNDSNCAPFPSMLVKLTKLYIKPQFTILTQEQIKELQIL